jgi:thiol-disulfide isomerase/thioredoxin
VKRSPLVILMIAVVVTALLLARFYVARRHRASPASAVRLSLRFSGQMAPDFALESLDGETVRLSDFHGQAVLLNFWATWCGPCKIEMPWFEQMQKQYGSQGLEVIGIAMDDASKKDIAEFASNLGIDYPILLGKESVGEAYGGVQFLPATFYVGRDGKVVDKVFGLKGRSEIEDNIKRALGRSQLQ